MGNIIKDKKKSDTIIVYGCGWSINNLSDEEKERLSSFDSVGFNYFCKSKIPTTFYFLREQNKKDIGCSDEKKTDFIRDINKYYLDSFLISIDMLNSGHVWKGKRGWIELLNNFKNENIILKELYYEDLFWRQFPETPNPHKKLIVNEHKMDYFIEKIYDTDIFRNIYYYSCSMSLVFHLIAYLRYKRVIFVGVDLCDHRYFWLPYDKLREQTKRKKRSIDSYHKTHKFICSCAKSFNKVSDIDMFVYNEQSLLSEIIPLWEWNN